MQFDVCMVGVEGIIYKVRISMQQYSLSKSSSFHANVAKEEVLCLGGVISYPRHILGEISRYEILIKIKIHSLSSVKELTASGKSSDFLSKTGIIEVDGTY